MKKKEYFIIAIFLLIGLFIFTSPMLFDFDKLPGNYGDARFINYVLEHGYLWLKKVEIHSEFWNMPVYYPMKNTLAYSDILLGGMFIYIPIRFFVDNPQSAFQIFYVIICILNYLIFYFFSRRIFKLDILFSSFASFLFAFSLTRHAQSGHLQLFLQFYMILSIFCFLLISQKNSKIKNKILFSGGVVFFLVQIYTTFYFGWYMCFCLPIVVFALLIQKSARLKMIKYLKCLDKSYLLIVFFGLLMLLPLCYHYFLVGSIFAKAQPSKISHLFFSHSFLDSLFVDCSYFYFSEAMLGIGFLTLILTLFAILKSKYKISLLFFIIIFVSCFVNSQIYSFLYDNFLPMGAIRALGRYIFVLIPIFAILLANYLNKLKSFKVALLLMCVIILEQIPYLDHFHWSKNRHSEMINRFIYDDSCDVVYYDTNNQEKFMTYNLDAMWFASNNNKYCVNEYSGFVFKYNPAFLDKKCYLRTK